MSYNNDAFNNKLLSYFRNRYRGIQKSTKGWYRLNCPFCFGNKSFGINPIQNKAKCHKCDYNQRLTRCVAELENKETISDLVLYIDENFEDTSIFDRAPKIEREEISLPEGFRLLSFGNSFTAKTARGYAKKRGFNIDYLTSRGVGYCESGKYIGSLIFPFYYNGKLVYYQNRRFLMGLGSGRKFDNPPEEQFGVGKSKLIYNRDALYLYDGVYLLESITNSLTMGDRGIGILGKSVSDYQFSDIIRSPVKRITILLDPDAIENAINLALRLCNHKTVKLVYWPGSDDVNKMGRKKTIEIIHKFKFQNYSELIAIKNTYAYNKDAIHTYK